MGLQTVEIEKKVRQFAKKVKARYANATVILFGSRARGDFLKTSDYDFLIISPSFQNADFLERATDVLRQTRIQFGADILCYTPQEFENKKKQIGTIQTAVAEGIVL